LNDKAKKIINNLLKEAGNESFDTLLFFLAYEEEVANAEHRDIDERFLNVIIEKAKKRMSLLRSAIKKDMRQQELVQLSNN